MTDARDLLIDAQHARAVVVAVETLKELLGSPDPLVQVRAARSILRLSNKLTEASLRARLDALEAETKAGRLYTPTFR